MRRSEPAPSGDRRRFPLRRSAFTTGAGVLCAGLFYGYVLVPLGISIPCPFRLITGWRCPGCGISRLCLDLLHGRFSPVYNWGLVLAAPWGLGALWAERRKIGAARALTWGLLGYLLAWGVLRNLWGI